MFDSKSQDLVIPEMVLALQPASERIVSDKRLLPGETLTDARRRVAKALAAVEKNPSEWEELFYWALHFAFPAGRVMANAGAGAVKTAVSTINCTVSDTIGDSMAEIMKAASDAAITLKYGCGIGYSFTTLRPAGAFVSGAGAYTSGPLPFMDIFDSVCKTVSSAGGRRGAQMGVLDVFHPDIESFITAKRQDGRLRAFNLSALIDDEFMQAVRADTEYPLYFPAFPGDQHQGPPVFKFWPLQDERYEMDAEGRAKCKVYARVKARDLFGLIMRSTYDFAEPGVLFGDSINRMNPLWFAEWIRATNPCVTGDTWVQTQHGPQQVVDLVGKPTTVIVDGKPFQTGAGGFFSTGRKEVVELQTKEGWSLKLTKDHLIQRVTSTRFKQEFEWVKAGELQPGDQVRLHEHGETSSWAGNGSEDEGYLLGMLVGDGHIKEDKAIISVWPSQGVVNGSSVDPEQPIIEAVEKALHALPHRSDFRGFMAVAGRSEQRVATASLKQLAAEYGLTPSFKGITKAIETASSDFSRGFLRGLFDADGSVQGSQAKGVSIRLSQSNLETLRAVQRMLARLGIIGTVYQDRRPVQMREMPDGRGGSKAYECQANHELVISSSNIQRFASRVGFNHGAKAERLESLMKAYVRAANRERFTATVTALVNRGVEEVFDVQVPGPNCFDANGLYAHNCGEQPLPPDGACLLGSVMLASFIKNPFKNTASFDFPLYRRVVRVFARMLDNVVEINGLPLERQRAEIFRKRRHGMGFLGLGSSLVMLGMRYGSQQAVEFTEAVSRELAVENWRAGLALAKEKGPAPIMLEDFEITPRMLIQCPRLAADGYKAGDKLPGRVLHARYSAYMSRIAEVDPELVEELAEVGARYSHATSIAPTGTMAAGEGNNASNGIEPTFGHYYIRNMIVPGKKTKEAIPMYSYELLAYKELVDPKVDPEKLPEIFSATADGVTPKEHVDMQAAAQKWVDSAISKTVNVPTDIPFEEFQDLYLYAWENGLKGCTTFRFNPERFQGVLVRQEDLENTVYEFALADGTVVRAKGAEMIDYDGNVSTAANLFDALKEGTYGRF